MIVSPGKVTINDSGILIEGFTFANVGLEAAKKDVLLWALTRLQEHFQQEGLNGYNTLHSAVD